MTLLASSERTRVWFMPGEGETLVVTFSHLRADVEEDVIWGGPLFRKLGVPAIGFVAAQNHWYPFEDTVSLIERISGVLAHFSHVVVYGYSMGAYAAIKFSRSLNADLVIALSPQFSIAEPDVGTFDWRFAAYYKPDLHDGMAIRRGDTSGSVYVFRDPAHKDDVLNADAIAAAIDCEIVPLAFVGHGTAQFISSSGMSGAFFKLVLEREFDLRAVRTVVRSYRRRSASYFALASSFHSRRGQHEKAQAALRQAIAIDGRDLGLRLKMAESFIKSNRPDAAEQELSGMTLDAMDQPFLGVRLGQLLTMLGRGEDALALLSAVVERWPRDANARIKLANHLRSIGRQADALDQATAAQSLYLGIPSAWRGMAFCWRDLGETDKSLAAMATAVAMRPTDEDMRLTMIELMLDAGRFEDAEAEAGKAEALGLQSASAQQRLDTVRRRLDFLRRIPEVWNRQRG